MNEVWSAIIEQLNDDDAYKTLVGTRTFYGLPRAAVDTFPAVRLLLVGDLPTPTVPGDYETRLQIDVTAESGSAAWPVVRLIESILRHPTRENTAPIETENYWVRGALPRNTVSIPTQRDNPTGGGKLVQLSTDWTLKVTKKD